MHVQGRLVAGDRDVHDVLDSHMAEQRDAVRARQRPASLYSMHAYWLLLV